MATCVVDMTYGMYQSSEIKFEVSVDGDSVFINS